VRASSSPGRWVLVSDGGSGSSRDAVAAIRGVAYAGYRAAATVNSRSPLTAPSRYAGRRVLAPPATSPAFPEAIRSELQAWPYLTVLPASEPALLALGGVPRHLVDKVELSRAAQAAGLSVPPSQAFGSSEELLDAADRLPYPVVVKPTIRRYWAFRADSPDQVTAGVVEDGPVLVQPYVEEPIGAVAGVMWGGALMAASHERWLRIWPLDCGLATSAVTVDPDTEIEHKLVRLLEGYEGLFCAQFVGKHLIDLNLRIHSSHPLAVAAGANLVGTYCDLLEGRDVVPRRAHPGRSYRWVEGDLRHAFAALRQGRMELSGAIRALMPRAGTAHSVESLKDPAPMVVRLLQAGNRALGRTVRSSASGRRLAVASRINPGEGH
jgi:hypothetical protein